MTKEEFSMYIFKTLEVSEGVLCSYYEDWQQSGYSIDLFKSLLKTRG